MLKPRPVQTIRDQIADQLRADLISGLLRPGERIREEDMATRFGVSRGPVRDVLIQLTKEGLLVGQRNAGVVVNDAPTGEMQALLMDLRKRIETHAIETVCGKLTQEDVTHLDNLLSEFGAALSQENWSLSTQIDIQFHEYFVELAGGQDLINVWKPIILRMRMNYKHKTDPEQIPLEHKAILDALALDNLEQATTALHANIR